MSSRIGLSIVSVFATATTAFGAELHNFVLFIPRTLPAAVVEDSTTPTLARFRFEGVNFVNSHSGFPPLRVDESRVAAEFNVEGLMKMGEAAGYSTLLIQGAEGGSGIAERLQPMKEAHRPFLLIYWIDGLTPRAVDNALAATEDALRAQGLYESTNIVVAAEHGVSSVLKLSGTSISLELPEKPAANEPAVDEPAVGDEDDETPLGEMPTGFLSIDVTASLQRLDPTLSLFDPDRNNRVINWLYGEHPERGNAIIAFQSSDPHLTVEARGGHDLIYLPPRLKKDDASRFAQIVIHALFRQDYVSGVFVNEKRVGQVSGALSLEHIGWVEAPGVRLPDIVVNFASVSGVCERPMMCVAMIADTPLAEKEEIHGAFSRADTWTFLAARGPDFQTSLTDRIPASNADIARTIAELLMPKRAAKEGFGGRVLSEGLKGNENMKPPVVRQRVIASKYTADGIATEVALQSVGKTKYFDAAGFPGWTVGIRYHDAPAGWAFWRWDLPRPRAFRIDVTP